MAPPSLSRPPARLPDDRDRLSSPSPQPALPDRPPGGEHHGRLPGPLGPDRLASGAQPPRHIQTFVLPGIPESAGLARRQLRTLLTAWHVGEEARDNAVLVASELVGNAIAHSVSERIVFRVVLTAADALRLEVEDQRRGLTRPHPRQPGPDEQGGRGLLLVEVVSAAWGVIDLPHRPGRTVWAELSPEAPPGSPAPAPSATERPTPHSAEGPLSHGPNPHP
ncbi:ATP-binding protein [Streptomyces broussonetiae]|uniref:ATP-binding protein n=1 Tax=Streptomyces broussonetiae TaxID=2686304 RepID=A0ABV5ED25_9ACTN